MKELILSTALIILGVNSAHAASLKPSSMMVVGSVNASGAAPCEPMVNTRMGSVILPDGTTTPFVIPPGYVFVITDVTWSGGSSPAAPWTFNLSLATVPTARRAVLTVPAVAPNAAVVAGSVHLNTGIVVAEGISICADLRSGANVTAVDGRIYGYLTKDR